MKIRFSFLSACVLLGMFFSNASADPLKKVAKKMAQTMKDYPNKKIAVLNFPYHNGYTSSGSTLVQERLTTYLTEHEEIEIIERHLLKKILNEMNLEQTGIIDSTTTKDLGKVLGVTALVTGTLNDLKKGKTEVNARIIHTETGKILAAQRVKIKRTWTDAPVPPSGLTDTQPYTDDKKDDFLGEPLIQFVVLLDTSNSMDGLIRQTKAQLWKIVNELSLAEKDGNNPTIQVALYEYGNDSLSQGENYLQQVLPFSTNLDIVSEKLFELKTNGGKEYCGAVIQDAVKGLEWDKHTDVYKVIFIAGNEPFTQGPVNFREAIKSAVKKDIIINTIFCGNKQQGIATKWEAGAQAGKGAYLNIDQEVKVVAIEAPQDAEIQRLARELNNTFIPYGAEGEKAIKLQEDQDKKAESLAVSGAQIQRALFKARKQYSRSAATWDLVTQIKSGALTIDKINKKNLPRELQSMSDKELKEHIEKKSIGKKEIQEKIKKLEKERRKYIVRKEKEGAEKGKQTLDYAIINALRSQAIKKNFIFKE